MAAGLKWPQGSNGRRAQMAAGCRGLKYLQGSMAAQIATGLKKHTQITTTNPTTNRNADHSNNHDATQQLNNNQK